MPAPSPPGGAAAAACRTLVRSLPRRLEGRPGRRLRPADPYAAAWGEPPVVLRCGVPAPAGRLGGAYQPISVDGIAWVEQPGRRSVRWTSTGRLVDVELALPRTLPAEAYLVDLAGPVGRLPG